MRFRLLIAAVVLAQALLTYGFVAQRFPLSGDDYSYLYQARLFASGRFYAQDPLYDYRHPLHACIQTNAIRDDGGRRFSKYAPGWPAVLSLGVLAHAPWLVQPLLAALLTLWLLWFVEARHGPAAVRTAGLLLTLCLFYGYYGASLRPHLATALCVFGAYLAQARARAPEGSDGGGAAWIAVAGALLGASALMRYIDWAPLGGWIAYTLVRDQRRRDLALFAAVFTLVAAGNLVHGWMLSGDPFVVPTHLGGDAGDHDALTLSWDGVIFTIGRLAMLCWVFPPVLLVARYWGRAREAGLDRLGVTLFAVNVAVYALFGGAPGGPGPRYYFAYFPLLVVAVVDVHQRFVRGRPGAMRWWHVLLVAQVVGSLVFVARETYTLHGRRDVERTIAEAERSGTGPRVVRLTTGTYRTDAADLTMNPPDLESAQTLFVANCSPAQVEDLQARFPNREWLAYSYPGALTPLER